MEICDVSDLVTGKDAKTTKALGTFYASNISTAVGTSTLSAREATVSLVEVKDEQTLVSQVTTNAEYTNLIQAAPEPVYPDYYYSSGGYEWSGGDGGGGCGGTGGGSCGG
jgi:hypothetical protein